MKNFTINFSDHSSKQVLYDCMKVLDGVWNVKIERIKEKRSSNQNRYFHGIIVKYIAQEIGEWEEETKENLKAMFLSYTENVYGVEVTKVRSTAKLSTIEFEEFNERCRMFASDFLNVQIPLPNEVILD